MKRARPVSAEAHVRRVYTRDARLRQFAGGQQPRQQTYYAEGAHVGHKTYRQQAIIKARIWSKAHARAKRRRVQDPRKEHPRLQGGQIAAGKFCTNSERLEISKRAKRCGNVAQAPRPTAIRGASKLSGVCVEPNSAAAHVDALASIRGARAQHVQRARLCGKNGASRRKWVGRQSGRGRKIIAPAGRQNAEYEIGTRCVDGGIGQRLECSVAADGEQQAMTAGDRISCARFELLRACGKQKRSCEFLCREDGLNFWQNDFCAAAPRIRVDENDCRGLLRNWCYSECTELLVVLSRTMSSGSMVMDLGYGDFAGAAIRRNSVSAAITPMCRSGWRTVVRPGF